MFSLTDGPLHVLTLGAHPDDIEIGCGATLLSLLGSREDVTVTWVVLSGNLERGSEAGESAERFLDDARDRDIRVAGFRDAYFPYDGDGIKKYFDALGNDVDPHIIFTHHRNDLHQDHRLVSELTSNTFRNHLILEYEIPKYDGDLGTPGLFVPVSEEALDAKIEILMESFPSQHDKPWFNLRVFRALPVLRGVESRSPTGLAEAFHVPKLRLDLGVSQ